MKKVVIASAIAVIGIALGYFLLAGDKKESAGESASSTVVAKRGYISRQVESTGQVEANLVVEIKCKASGEVKAVPFDVSDHVKRGDLLVELDPVEEERTVRQAKVNLSSSKAKLQRAEKALWQAQQELVNSTKSAEVNLQYAQVNYEDAKSKAERMKRLLESKRVSQEDCETAETTAARALADLEGAKITIKELKVAEEALELKRLDVVLARDEVESNQVQLEMAEQRLTDTKVFAPIDGVVAKREVQVGHIVSSPTANVGGGSTLVVLADLSRIFVIGSVDESDIGVVEVGQPTVITVDAYPNLNLHGKVVQIATEGSSVSNVVTFDVKIEVLSEDKDKLKPGMTANVEILVGESENALLVPSEAVQRKNGRPFVMVMRDGGPPERREVEIGIDDGVSTEILSGLKDGERVLQAKGQVNSQWSQQQKQQQQQRRPPMPPMM